MFYDKAFGRVCRECRRRQHYQFGTFLLLVLCCPVVCVLGIRTKERTNCLYNQQQLQQQQQQYQQLLRSGRKKPSPCLPACLPSDLCFLGHISPPSATVALSRSRNTHVTNVVRKTLHRTIDFPYKKTKTFRYLTGQPLVIAGDYCPVLRNNSVQRGAHDDVTHETILHIGFMIWSSRVWSRRLAQGRYPHCVFTRPCSEHRYEFPSTTIEPAL